MEAHASPARLAINALPTEIIYQILGVTADLNSREGVAYVFGLLNTSATGKALDKYVKAPVAPDLLRWNSTRAIRQVCSLWHVWALNYALREVYIQEPRGPERWAELPWKQDTYGVYELIQWPSGAVVSRKRMAGLEATQKLLSYHPHIAANIRRVWIHGFYEYTADIHIYALLRKCTHLTSLTVPWTMLRRLDGQQWETLLRADKACALESLHIHAGYLANDTASEPRSHVDLKPWFSSKVSLDKLKRLKFSGNTNVVPLDDNDLCAVARTATNLRELYVDSVDTITIKGLNKILHACRASLHVVEHSSLQQGNLLSL